MSEIMRGINRDSDGICSMTGREAVTLMQYLQIAFDTVRLVDATVNYQYTVGENGELVKAPYRCYAVWQRNTRCENCISAKCLFSKTKLAKFEFVDDDIYHVLAMYVEVDGHPYSMEMVSKVTDETLLGGYGREELVESISNHNRKLYQDPVTDIHNRRYYEEQLSGLWNTHAVALLDVDNFKSINDRYGHPVGDIALRLISGAICSCVRKSDAVIRYGGDEFVVVFQEIPEGMLDKKLEDIRAAVHELVMEEHPEIRFSVSIGAVYGPGKTAELLQVADGLMYQAKGEKNFVITKSLAQRSEKGDSFL